MTVDYRPLVDEDRAFVISAWVQSYKRSRDVSFVPVADFAPLYAPILSAILDRVTTIVAQIGDVLIGFLAYAPNYVYFCYVKQSYRRAGIARGLFAAAGIGPSFGYAARTRSSWEVRDKISLAKYDPFFARYVAPRKP